VDDEDSIRAIRRARELGITFFDVADVYGAGHGERLLGRAIAGERDTVVIATKWGNTFDEQTRQMGEPDPSPEHLRRAVRASLERLGTDYIDLYQLHLNDLPIPQALELIPTLEDLVERGLIRSYGWSTDFPDRATAFAEAGTHCTAVQHDLSVLRGSAEVLDVCDRFDLASINRGPLAMGLLAGKYTTGSRFAADDLRGSGPEWMVYYRDGRPSEEWLRRIAAIREVLTSGGRTVAQGALAWLWARSDRTVPIPGCRTQAQAEENAGALEFGPLAKTDLALVEALLGRA
jgi:aryl-alcohol dehydrogenase-like predicted oxidoreductase